MTLLHRYSTADACYQEERRIAEAMAEAYPGDHSFTIKCLPDTVTERK